MIESQVAVGSPAGDPTLDVNGDLTPFEVFRRVGVLTRKLHDALDALGYTADIEAAVGSLPDARSRLDYVATLTGRAAERVLSAAEEGRVIQDGLASDAAALVASWPASGVPDAALAASVREFLKTVPQITTETNSKLSDIMLAQDFHDLTGQAIQRVVTMARSVEEQLVKLLLDATPPERRAVLEAPGLSGPVINPEGRDDVVSSQEQVDDLLESLGF